MNQDLYLLIQEGHKYNFNNNSYLVGGTLFSRATPEFLSWVSKVEDYIRSNYDENSGPYKLIETLRKEKLSGNYQSEFESELAKLKGAIDSCQHISPKKKKLRDDNPITSLIKNYFFWTVLVVVAGGAYKLGYDNGASKFDRNIIELTKENELLLNERSRLEKNVAVKDSTIIDLKSKLK